ncbi:hypothetical protein IKQ26_00955 [bacterium]|nr:hypothetical protein [bacterium]
MHFIGIVWSIIIFLFIAGLGLFIGDLKANGSVGFGEVVIYSFIATIIIIIIANLKKDNPKIKNIDMTPEEKEKRKKITEWSRRNNC